MRDKYNLNTLPAGSAGVDDHEIGTQYIMRIITIILLLVLSYCTNYVR